MPSLTGLTLSAAYARATGASLHVVSVEDLNTAAIPAPSTATQAPGTNATPPPPSTPAPAESGRPFSPATVVAQSPPSGHRVQPGDPVRITLGH